MNELSATLIEEIKDLWNTGRKVMVEVAARLKALKEDTDLWAGYKTFPQFIEQEVGIGQSQTSKLLTIAEYYLDKYSPQEIGPVDYENLYRAARLPGSVEENLAKAKTLSRGELRAETQEKAPCPHENKKVCCVDCWEVEPN